MFLIRTDRLYYTYLDEADINISPIIFLNKKCLRIVQLFKLIGHSKSILDGIDGRTYSEKMLNSSFRKIV